jgi:hypothetical protein
MRVILSAGRVTTDSSILAEFVAAGFYRDQSTEGEKRAVSVLNQTSMPRPNRPSPPKTCPECGEPLVANGTYCRACGLDVAAVEKDERDGGLGDVDLPQGYGGGDDPSGFDYDEFLASEGLVSPVRRKGKRLFWTIVAIVALAAFVMAFVI